MCRQVAEARPLFYCLEQVPGSKTLPIRRNKRSQKKVLASWQRLNTVLSSELVSKSALSPVASSNFHAIRHCSISLSHSKKVGKLKKAGFFCMNITEIINLGNLYLPGNEQMAPTAKERSHGQTSEF